MGYARAAWDVLGNLASKAGAVVSEPVRRDENDRYPNAGTDMSESMRTSLSEARKQADDARQAVSEREQGRDTARKELLAAKDATTYADLDLLDAEHAQADAEAMHKAARDRLNEAKEGRERLAGAISALDGIIDRAMANARMKTKEMRETVLRLSRDLAVSEEGHEELSTLLAAARWDLARAIRYEEFLPMLSTLPRHANAVASYRESDPDAVIVTSERKVALDEYDKAYDEMLEAEAVAMSDEEFAEVSRAEAEAWEGVLRADKGVSDARARLDASLAKEDAAWIRLDRAGRRLSSAIREAVSAEKECDRIAVANAGATTA